MTIDIENLRLVLWQARYALKDYNVKQPDCGFDKLAGACEQAADTIITMHHTIERYKAALEYYSAVEHYDGGDVPGHIYVLDDHGRYARTALAPSHD